MRRGRVDPTDLFHRSVYASFLSDVHDFRGGLLSVLVERNRGIKQ